MSKHLHLCFPFILLLIALSIFPVSTAFTFCRENQYYDTTTSACASCDSSCLYCSSSSTSDCYSCNTGLYLIGGSCLSSCPTGYSANSTTRVCQPCLSGCGGVCATGWYAYSTYCVQSCPAGTTQNTAGTACTAPTGATGPIIIPLFVQGSTLPVYETLTISPYVSETEAVTYAWTSTSSNLLNGVVTTSKIINIPPANLNDGTTYVLTLSAKNSIATTTATFTFTTGSNFGGSLTVSPVSSITAMSTALNFALDQLETNEPFFYDVVMTYDTTSAQQVVSSTKFKTEFTYVDAIVLAKGLARFQTIQSTKLPPIDADRIATIWLFVYNDYKFSVTSQQVRVKSQTSSVLSDTSNFGTYVNIGDLAMASEALKLLSPVNTYAICQRLSQATDLARYFSGKTFCSPTECYSNGQCISSGTTHSCQCNQGFVGQCCSVNSNNLAGLSSGVNLYSVLASQLNSIALKAENAGLLAYAINSLSYNGEFLTVADITNLIALLYDYTQNVDMIDVFIAPKLYNAVSLLTSFGQVKIPTSNWRNQLTMLDTIRDSVINALMNNLQFKENIYYLLGNEGFQIIKDTSSLVISSDKGRLLTRSIVPPSSLLDLRMDLGTSVVIIPSVSMSSSNIYTSAVYTSASNLLTTEMSTFVTGFMLQDQYGNAVTDLVGEEVQTISRKSVVSNATFAGLWTCSQQSSGVYSSSKCRKLDENYTHILCGCEMDSQSLEITSVLNRANGRITKQCILESVELYQPETDFLFIKSIVGGKCFPFKFSLNGLFFVIIFFLGFVTAWNAIVYLVNLNFDSKKKYIEILSLNPLYSIFRCPSLPYDSRFIRANYFICHVLDILGMGTIARQQAWRLHSSYYLLLFLNGLFTIFVLQYGTAAFWNFLYRLQFGPTYRLKNVQQRARWVIIILCWIWWIGYFIGRWGVNPWEEQRFRLIGGFELLAVDLLVAEPIVILLCYKSKLIRDFVKFRGYYTPYSHTNIVYGTKFGDGLDPIAVTPADLSSAKEDVKDDVKDAAIDVTGRSGREDITMLKNVSRADYTARTAANNADFTVRTVMHNADYTARSVNDPRDFEPLGDPRSTILETNNMKEIISQLENRI